MARIIKERKFQVVENVKSAMLELSDIVAGQWYTSVLEEMEEQNIVSPIEQLFYAYWKFNKYDDIAILNPQHKVGPFFIDFSVDSFIYFLNTSQKDDRVLLRTISADLPNVAIELDGHWHEKNPEEVEKDKKRERFLIKEGWKVLRFSGREVVRDPQKCVEEAYLLAHKGWDATYRKFLRLGGW